MRSRPRWTHAYHGLLNVPSRTCEGCGYVVNSDADAAQHGVDCPDAAAYAAAQVEEPCPVCHGRGTITVAFAGPFPVVDDCPECRPVEEVKS